jgi:hypothetical protein
MGGVVSNPPYCESRAAVSRDRRLTIESASWQHFSQWRRAVVGRRDFSPFVGRTSKLGATHGGL